MVKSLPTIDQSSWISHSFTVCTVSFSLVHSNTAVCSALSIIILEQLSLVQALRRGLSQKA